MHLINYHIIEYFCARINIVVVEFEVTVFNAIVIVIIVVVSHWWIGLLVGCWGDAVL